MKLGSLLCLYYRQTIRHWIKGIFIIILFAISIRIIYMAIYELVQSRYNIMYIKSFFEDRDELYNITIQNEDFPDDVMLDFIEDLGRIDGVVWSGKYFFERHEFQELKDNENFLSYNGDMLKGTIYDDYPSYIGVCRVDRSMVYILGLSELARPVHDDVIPALVGSDYTDYFMNGEIYTDELGIRYRICGVLPDNYRVPAKTLLRSQLPYEELDDKIVVVDNYGGFVTNASKSIYCKTDSSLETEQRIETLAKSYALHITLNTINGAIEDYRKEQKEYLQTTVLFMGITVIGAVLAMISSAIINIVLKKQEFGVLYANGVSKADSMWLVALENGMYMSMAFLIATFTAMQGVIKENIYYLENQLEIFRNMVVWRVFLTAFILFVISTIIPVMVLGRLKTAELLGGNEL